MYQLFYNASLHVNCNLFDSILSMFSYNTYKPPWYIVYHELVRVKDHGDSCANWGHEDQINVPVNIPNVHVL